MPKTFVKDFHDAEEVKKMVDFSLGTTDMKLSKLGIGGASLGHCYGFVNYIYNIIYTVFLKYQRIKGYQAYSLS